MTVEDPNVVDFIGVSRKDGRAMLTISDHLEWEDEAHHIALLSDKIRSYIDFVESGQLEVKYPDAGGREVVIEVVGAEPMPEHVRARMALAFERVENTRMTLLFSVLHQ